jgi:hypothetical protein
VVSININIDIQRENFQMTLKNISLNLELGQTILVGQNREPAQITKIEFHEKSGEIDINTTKGPRKVLSFALCNDEETYTNPADKYR